jgi:hypothetical protein
MNPARMSDHSRANTSAPRCAIGGDRGRSRGTILCQWNTLSVAPIAGKRFRWFSTCRFAVKVTSKTVKCAATQSRSVTAYRTTRSQASTPGLSNRVASATSQSMKGTCPASALIVQVPLVFPAAAIAGRNVLILPTYSVISLLACALRCCPGQRHFGKNLRPSGGFRYYRESSPHKPESLAHTYQTDSCIWVTQVRVKTSPIIRNAKTDAIRVRAEFNQNALSFTRKPVSG